MSRPATTADFNAEILREQVRLAFRHLPMMQSASFVVALVLSYLALDSVASAHIFAWILMILAVVTSRIMLYARFGRVRDGLFPGEYWRNLYLMLALVSGVIWGLSAFIIFPAGNVEFISLFVLVMASLSAATTISHSSIKLAPAAWAGPAMLLYAVRCVMEGERAAHTIALLIVIYLLTVLRYSLTQNSAITAAISLKFENLQLLEEVQSANSRLGEDVARRERTEEALRIANNFREAIIEYAAEGLCVYYEIPVHPLLRFLVWNQRMKEITGYSIEDINSRGWYESLYPDPGMRQAAHKQMDRRKEGNISSDEEWEIVRGDGRKRSVRVTTTRLQSTDGRDHYLSLMEDITERKQAAEATSRLAGIVESSEDAIIGKSLGGMITSWNSGAERLYGYTVQEVLGRHLSLIIPPQMHDETNMILERIGRGERIEHYETVRKRKDETLVTVSLTVSPIKDASGKIVGAATIARDVTGRKQAEREREKLIKELQAALGKVRTLSGLLPICASCKKIRDDRGYWNQIESFIRDHSEAEFSHSICPDCMKALYPKFTDEDP